MTDQIDKPEFPALGVSVACWRAGKVLLVRRGKAPNKGLWSLPGGHVEPGERPERAALRELFEETSVTAALEGPVTRLDVVRRDETGAVRSRHAISVFRARWLDGEAVAGDDAVEVQWRGVDDLVGLRMTRGTRDLIRTMASDES